MCNLYNTTLQFIKQYLKLTEYYVLFIYDYSLFRLSFQIKRISNSDYKAVYKSQYLGVKQLYTVFSLPGSCGFPENM